MAFEVRMVNALATLGGPLPTTAPPAPSVLLDSFCQQRAIVKVSSAPALHFILTNIRCLVCELGCTECADGTGNCVTCKTGFSQDANDSTKCNPPVSTTSSGTICPDGSFGNGTVCTTCSPTCSTCTAGTSNDCIICASGHYSLNGSCVSTNANGVCEGSTDTIADNNKHECDSEFTHSVMLRLC